MKLIEILGKEEVELLSSEFIGGDIHVTINDDETSIFDVKPGTVLKFKDLPDDLQDRLGDEFGEIDDDEEVRFTPGRSIRDDLKGRIDTVKVEIL